MIIFNTFLLDLEANYMNLKDETAKGIFIIIINLNYQYKQIQMIICLDLCSAHPYILTSSK